MVSRNSLLSMSHAWHASSIVDEAFLHIKQPCESKTIVALSSWLAGGGSAMTGSVICLTWMLNCAFTQNCWNLALGLKMNLGLSCHSQWSFCTLDFALQDSLLGFPSCTKTAAWRFESFWTKACDSCHIPSAVLERSLKLTGNQKLACCSNEPFSILQS